MSFQSFFLAATALVATANAHVTMKSPIPYSVDKIDNGPIMKSQYPCKSQNGFTVSTMNAMKVGEKQTIELDGSAVHGGGSCQLSVTLDTEPTPDSVFKVIKSMEGGCPGTDGKALAYDFELPASIPDGKATFAWTWFSKLSGVPELYMNCAPIEVTGGASDKSAFDALPNMLVANLDDTCESVPNFSVEFPDGGAVVQKGSTNDAKPPTGSGCGSTSGTTPAEPAVPSNPGGVFAPGASSAAPNSPTAAPAVPTASPAAPTAAPAVSTAAPAVPTAAPAVPSTSTTLITVTGKPTAAKPTATGTPAQPTTPSSPSAGGGSGTCTQNGSVVCNGPTQFGLCNNGNVVWQAVAAGTTCTNGAVQKRGYNGRIARPRYNNPRLS